MTSVVAIHNSVNERAWREVMAWEALHAGECSNPRLKKFQGRPSDYSPKARLLNTLVRGNWEGVHNYQRVHSIDCAWDTQVAGYYLTMASFQLGQGFALPFDRHDWIVDRCGREVRYVIDFYSGAPNAGSPTAAVAMFLDVRPALDSFEAVWDRIRLQFSWVWSGRWRD